MCLSAVAFAAPALGQSGPTIEAEVASDESRRGISWSEGRVAPAASIRLDRGALALGARVAATRDSARHAGAEAVVDVEGGYIADVGPLQLEARAIGHFFAGSAIGADYGEVAVGAGYLLGPARVTARATYAPDQHAIGGDNLYLNAGASLGIPATPFTVSAAVGRTTGSTDDPFRAARLRPAGDYTDWRVGVEHITGPLLIGVDYVGTDIDQRGPGLPLADLRHSGDRLVGRVAFRF
ncbi:protein of unknown function (Gcw_chp) [Sphingomonas guangdongensis]|uniref:Outer membrane protein beta-barrel domain-containing protein n=1 Tax=Sphingomonas guangdongensis TaxID=1141890 RepID=A0A285R0S4_9SPHN|nr:protein of unknown function (Gcw_chp) [Sphingomonas guangdongensis]